MLPKKSFSSAKMRHISLKMAATNADDLSWITESFNALFEVVPFVPPEKQLSTVAVAKEIRKYAVENGHVDSIPDWFSAPSHPTIPMVLKQLGASKKSCCVGQLEGLKVYENVCHIQDVGAVEDLVDCVRRFMYKGYVEESGSFISLKSMWCDFANGEGEGWAKILGSSRVVRRFGAAVDAVLKEQFPEARRQRKRVLGGRSDSRPNVWLVQGIRRVELEDFFE